MTTTGVATTLGDNSSSLHQGLCGLAENSKNAWNDGSYIVAVLMGTTARVASAAATLFQIITIPFAIYHSITQTVAQIKFQKSNWKTSNWKCAWTAVKITALTLAMIGTGILQSSISSLIPEIMYLSLKTQKIYYGLQIRRAHENERSITRQLLTQYQTGIRQSLSILGCDLDPEQFHGVFLDLWKSNALKMNDADQYGNPNAFRLLGNRFDLVKDVLIEASRIYFTAQIDLMLRENLIHQQDYPYYISFLTRYLNNRLAFNIANMSLSPGPIKKPDAQYKLGKILFEHMKNATKYLVKEKHYDADDIEACWGTSRHAVQVLAIYNMVKEAQVSADNKEITLKNSKEELELKAPLEVPDDKDTKVDLQKKFIELKILLNQLEEGCKGEKAKFYNEASKLIIDKFCEPDAKDTAKESQEKIAKLKADLEKLKEDDEKAFKLNSDIFQCINGFVEIISRKIINQETTTKEQKIDWQNAYTISDGETESKEKKSE